MSGNTREGAELGGLPGIGSGVGTDGRSIPPQTAPNQTSQGESSFGDSSALLFYMYLKMAEEEDKKMTERWEADADGILIFTGLFSAAVAALAAVSVQDLRQNSQDISAFYLGNIYQVLADPNTSSTTPTMPTLVKPPIFSPPSSAIWVNSLWFLSLVVSLTCALLATLLKQWARRYVSVTQPPRYSPHKRARIRAFCADGVDKLHLPWAIGALPAMLHLSLFLFFAGLLVYLSNINHTVFNVTAWWIGLSTAVYISITIMPIFRHDSPYHAPLSTSLWSIYHGIAYLALQTRWLIQYRGLRILDESAATRLFLLKVHYLERLLGGIRKAVENTAWKLSAEIDSRVLEWTFDAVDEDHELERFFEGIPGLYDSKVLRDPQQALVANLGLGKISSALMGLLDRTHASNLASESAKQRQLIICLKAARAMRLPQAIPRILQTIFGLPWNWVLQSAEMGHSLKNMSNDTDVEIALFARVIVAGIVANARERDSRWFTLASRQLGVPDRVLRAYLAHGDSVLLANLIHITRHIFCSLFETSRELAYASSTILLLLSKFDVRGTLSELQQDFCTLWNEIAQEARGRGGFKAHVNILRNTRHIYLALHQGTDAAPTAFSAATEARDNSLYEGSSYPLCNILGHHRSEPIRRIHELALVDGNAIPSTAPHHDTTLTTVAPSDFPPFGSPGHTDKSLPGGVPDARQSFIPITTSSFTAPESFHRDRLPTSSFGTTSADLTKDIADISYTTNPIPPSALSGAIASQQLEGTPIALPFVTNSPSAPIPVPPLRVDPHSSSDSAEIDATHLPRD